MPQAKRFAWAAAKGALEKAGVDSALYLPVVSRIAQGAIRAQL
jgi:hypothetical protein